MHQTKYLVPKTNVKITLDIDISYEEANFIKDTFVETYKLRDVTLVPVKSNEHENDTGAEIHFRNNRRDCGIAVSITR